jgi:hypothetical protein
MFVGKKSNTLSTMKDDVRYEALKTVHTFIHLKGEIPEIKAWCVLRDILLNSVMPCDHQFVQEEYLGGGIGFNVCKICGLRETNW